MVPSTQSCLIVWMMRPRSSERTWISRTLLTDVTHCNIPILPHHFEVIFQGRWYLEQQRRVNDALRVFAIEQVVPHGIVWVVFLQRSQQHCWKCGGIRRTVWEEMTALSITYTIPIPRSKHLLVEEHWRLAIQRMWVIGEYVSGPNVNH